ncbi:MAG: carboxypeptidase M32 [Verrucomicrobia bacterium]|nr:MAG: carboxypeptidase M32 [Verrucomicrobiota bacterium]TAE86234.1 MAG: carboxypeptidase M32 [Verrucomicrobiota bacterium]TAF23674.1 MAG: carboxypeptidase M32 [Verrucomicrobiota bacterium]TAF40217.1 MAG: carboxypeptidase M32 [Verrucomicrobiota bacterium]
MHAALDLLRTLAREQALVASAASVIGWDQETYLPDAAHGWRAEQLAWLSEKAHQLATSSRWSDALTAAENEGSAPALTAAMRREHDRATKLPGELIAREAQAASLGKQAWAAARKNSDFNTFAPHLESLLHIAREKAERWGYPHEPYDALLDGYERDTRASDIATLFDSLRPRLRELAATAVERSATRRAQLPAGPYPIAAQQALNAEIAAALGFDFQAGRIDTTAHPFCTTLGPRDIRLTTRYDETDFTSSLFGVMHEAGHGLYEQGLPTSEFGLPSGQAASLGIHESQSRLWENHIGRSRPFWEKWLPKAAQHFPQLRTIELDDFLSAIHRAEFSPVRVEADEATYDLHILLRFDIERLLVAGELAVKDVPAAWNDRFRDLFGFLPPDDARGCLQDIHWSMGGLGYFPTYTLGNLNAAQLFAAANQIPEIATATAHADYAPLLGWLRENIHTRTALTSPADLIQAATGRAPSPDDHLHHLAQRYTA